MKYLLTHGHLIIDDKREYLDGSLLINGEVIEDVYPQSNKLPDGPDIKVKDLNGCIVMPSFFDCECNKYNNNDGCGAYLAKDECVIEEHCLGLSINGMPANITNVKQVSLDLHNEDNRKHAIKLKEKGIRIIAIGNDTVFSDINDIADGISVLFADVPVLDAKKDNLNNCVFKNMFNCELIASNDYANDDLLRLVINNVSKNRIMLVSDNRGNSILNSLKKLYSLGSKYTDLLSYSSLNAYRFHHLDNRYGSIEKGKYAELLVMDNNLNIRSIYSKEKLIELED